VTNTFDQSNLIGIGNFGSVYKAVLHDGTAVAVKVLDLHKMGAPKSWVLECEALRNLRHRNLIKLVTVCVSVDFSGNDFRALVYELMSNGSLEDWIYQHRQHANGDGLNAKEVINIAIDAASALEYMHNDCGGQALHCDIKPSNVLLDGDMTAKVGDFG
jgi:serine/threonine protein kinase